MKNNHTDTLTELMIITVVIGILAAIAIPNFLSMQDRAKERAVKDNMHTIQVAMEDFNILTNGSYPSSASSMTPSGHTLRDLCRGGVYPTNPYTGKETPVTWGMAAAETPGAIGITTATALTYVIQGRGKNVAAYLPLSRSNFQGLGKDVAAYPPLSFSDF